MTKRIIALLLALILTVGLLPTVALADAPAADTNVVSGSIGTDGKWTRELPDQSNMPEGVETVSKTAKKVEDKENEYEVKLEVVLKKTESQENPGSAATVLVLDHSGSMNGCAYCKSTTDDGSNYYHTRGCKHYKPNQSVAVTPDQSRMTAATKAVKDFIKTYSGRFDKNGNETATANLNLGRWVCLVWFNETGGVTGGGKWVDVSNKSGYQTATNTDGWKAHDGTNLDCGLRLADHWLKQSPVASINKSLKNVIVLSDGEPTYYLSTNWELFATTTTIGGTKFYVHGNGSSCSENTYNTTKNTASTLRKSASLYTVCFGASDETIKEYDKTGKPQITVGNYLKDKIATKPKSGTNEKFAYDAADADALNTAFAAISKTIVSGLNTGTVKDTLPTGISSTVFGEGKTVMNWELNSTEFTKTEQTRDLGGGKKETVFTYTKTYTVTIDPEKAATTEINGEKYAPLNGETTLTVEVDGEKETIPFPIPAGKVTPTTFTVTWKSQDDKTELEKDENVAKNSKPSYDGATPTKAEDDMYTYTFAGWATEPNKDAGTLEDNLPNVTADVTYYAAFSKQLKQYTVTGTIDNGTVNNKASTDTQTVNAGGSSAAMTFTPAAGYKIISVKEKVGEVETTITDFAETGYTYPVKNDIKANITVDVKTAKRSDLSYTVRYLEKGTTNEIRTADTVNGQEFSATITGDSINHPAITGFIYDSCSPESITIGTDSEQNVITLYYTRKSYAVTFKDGANGAVFEDETQQVEYGKAIPSHAAPVRPGYNFTGWTSEPANYQPGTGTMPANNITFTARWTEKTSVTISYFAKEGGSVDPDSETLNPDTGVAKGSTAKANDGYRFVGWYDNEGCTGTALSTDASYTPSKPEAGWADKTYYAKFESLTYTITFETETGGTLTGRTNYTGLAYNADFPDEPEKSANSGYYFDGWYKDGAKVPSLPPKVTENATYTAKWLPYSSIGLDLTGKIQKTLNSDVALSNERFTINLTLEGAEAASATATATVSAIASGTGYTGTAPFQTASDEFKLTFTAPDTYKYYIAEEDGLRAGMTYDVNKPANGHQLVVVVQENASNHALFFESVTIDGTEVNPSDENDTTPWLTITNNYVEPKETFDLNTLITKKFEAAADSKTIPTGTYEFKAQIVETDSGWNKIDSGATYEGTATLTAGGTADFAFGNDRYLKLAAGDHYYLVSEISDTVSGTTGTISYDNLTYSLKITVGPNGKVTDVEVKNFAVVSSFAAENAVEFKEEDHITFNNTYFEEKDPNECTIDFSKFVKKELTTTGSKTVDEATFIVDAAGSYDGEAIANALTPVETQATTDEDVLNTTLTATIKNIVGGNVYEEPFTGSVTVSKPGHYTFTLTERKGTQSGVTYDESTYQVFVNIKRIGDNLVIRDAKTYLNNEPVELIKLENDAPVTAGYIIFKNTIDTGRDDYIPIIIPTIINKDTGMLNKTDHFAYVIGYPDGTVHPNGQITRAEVATIFFRLLRDEVRDGAFTTSNSYSDVAYGKWYNNPISTMSALGIITGYPDGTFKPNKPITRAEFAAIAARFDETQSGKSATFSDVIGHWAAKEIGIAYYNDWIKGYPDGTFKPDQNITRAEAMTLINRVLERKPESPADLLTNMNKWTDNMDTSKWYYLDVQEATNSHGYTRKTFNYELWRQMLPDPDWSRYER